jgi:hypothetical protein
MSEFYVGDIVMYRGTVCRILTVHRKTQLVHSGLVNQQTQKSLFVDSIVIVDVDLQPLYDTQDNAYTHAKIKRAKLNELTSLSQAVDRLENEIQAKNKKLSFLRSL